ncbi:hypothetical protein L210DRAFT_725819, partial [Boletus edulis BED1]
TTHWDYIRIYTRTLVSLDQHMDGAYIHPTVDISVLHALPVSRESAQGSQCTLDCGRRRFSFSENLRVRLMSSGYGHCLPVCRTELIGTIISTKWIRTSQIDDTRISVFMGDEWRAATSRRSKRHRQQHPPSGSSWLNAVGSQAGFSTDRHRLGNGNGTME